MNATAARPAAPAAAVPVISVTVKVRYAVFLTAVCGLVLTLYFVGPRLFNVVDRVGWREDAKFVLAVVGGGVAFYSAWYAALSYRANADREDERRASEDREAEARRDRERKCTSFDMLAALNQMDKVLIRRLIDDIKEKQLGSQQIYEAIKQDQALWKGVVSVLGELEDIAIAVRTGYADERVLFDSLAFMVKNMVDKLGGYIDMMRDQRRAPLLYIEVQEMARAWSNNRSFATGEAIPPTRTWAG